jgi:hypothetical protein
MVAVWLVEGDNWRVAVDIDEIAGRTALLVLGWSIAKFSDYAKQLPPG